MARPVRITNAQRKEAELKTGERKPGRKRIYVRDTLSKTKRGKNAIKEVQQIRTAALRAHSVSAQSIAEIEKLNADRQLTEKQLLFTRLWAQGETPRTAAVLAGYSENSSNLSWKLTRDPAILKLYHEEKKLYEEAGQMTRKRVMDMLQEAYDCAKLVNEPSSMVAAAREIGKMCGYYEPEVKIIRHEGAKLIDQLNNLSDAELEKLLEERGDTIIGEAVRVVDDTSLPALEAPRG